MKEIKTAEEFLTEKGILSNGKTVLGIKFSDGSIVTVNELLHEYASQFEPKWIPVEPVHEIEPGHYVFLSEVGIETLYVRAKSKSDYSRFATDYFKIEFPLLPTNDIEG